jgi:hypothetical protein
VSGTRKKEKGDLCAEMAATQVVRYEIALGGFFGLVVLFGIVTAHDDAVLFVLVKIELYVKVLQQVQVYNELCFFHGMNVFAVVQEHISLLAIGERLEEGWC